VRAAEAVQEAQEEAAATTFTTNFLDESERLLTHNVHRLNNPKHDNHANIAPIQSNFRSHVEDINPYTAQHFAQLQSQQQERDVDVSPATNAISKPWTVLCVAVVLLVWFGVD